MVLVTKQILAGDMQPKHIASIRSNGRSKMTIISHTLKYRATDMISVGWDKIKDIVDVVGWKDGTYEYDYDSDKNEWDETPLNHRQ